MNTDSLARFTHSTTFYLFALLALLGGSASAFANENALQIRANMVVDTPEALLAVVDRAKASGATSVQYSDTKLNRYGVGLYPGAKWEERTRAFIEGVKARDMDIILNTVTIGYCNSILASDTNLATGYPIINQALTAQGNKLVPISSASITNGGFERADGNNAQDWTFQDAPGSRTFIDSNIKRSGNSSFRADARDGEMSRVITKFEVKPFHQYTLKFWVRTQDLTARNLLVIVRDDNNLDRSLTNQRMSIAQEVGSRQYFSSPNDLSMPWTQMRIAFNSLDATTVNLGLSIFGGQAGSIWWDDVSISDTPTLNWLVRDNLPRSVEKANGQSLGFGADVAPIVDAKLGMSAFEGNYDTYHAAPEVSIASSANIADGDTVLLNGYHTVVTQSGQVSCSWNSEETYAKMKQIHETLEREFQPTGYRLNYDEIRTGGYEPTDTSKGTSGDALAASIERAYQDLFAIAPASKHYFWSDMVDPFHNATENYYQINNTLDGAWTTLDPSRVTLITWWEGVKITELGPDSLAFFSNLGFKQVLGAFYDADVQDNYDRWQAAASGIDGILGGLYASWTPRGDYSQIEAFGDLWWQNDTGTSVIDDISVFTAPLTVLANQSYDIDIPYQASEDREIVLALQNKDEQWKIEGTSRTLVSAGDGVANLQISLRAGATPGDSYAFTAYIKPVGGNWESRLDRETVKNISVPQ